MKFQIARTSDYSSTNPPCIGAGGEPHDWTIELESLDDLVSLARQHGEIIVTVIENSPMPYLEIYDDYRE